MESIRHLIDEIKTASEHKIFNLGSAEKLERGEQKLGVRFPDDLREFYTFCDGVGLFERGDGTYTYSFLSLEEIDTARMQIYGSNESEHGPPFCFGIVLVCDADYAGISYTSPLTPPIYIDIFHESYPEESPAIIARTFTDLLQRALISKEIYWFQEDFSLPP